jgi:hypothetical protein
MKKNSFVYLFTLIIAPILFSCNNADLLEMGSIVSERTIKSERENFKSDLIENTIENNLQFELNSDNEQKWQDAFWAMQLIQYKSKTTDRAIETGIKNFSNTEYDFKRSLLEVAYNMYPKKYNDEVEKLMPNIDDRKLYSMTILYLLKGNETTEKAQKYLDLLTAKYYDWGYHPITLMLYTELNNTISPSDELLPPLEDLLLMDLGESTSVVYSFHRKNRSYPGISIIRKQDGSFVRNDDGTLFTVSHLAKAVTGLPFYITNGNTPAGIYKIKNVSHSENVFIGPTPTLITAMPFEEDYFEFTTPKSKVDTLWDKKTYRQIFPTTWQYYLPIYESFFAGWAGRNEIIVHGTTIDPEYYKNESYYPYTPSLGCITSLEIWSEETGELVESEQVKLINKYHELESLKGYFILVDLDNKNEPVTTKDIMESIVRTGK